MNSLISARAPGWINQVERLHRIAVKPVQYIPATLNEGAVVKEVITKTESYDYGESLPILIQTIIDLLVSV